MTPCTGNRAAAVLSFFLLPETKSTIFHVRLTGSDRRKLFDLAEMAGDTPSEAIRLLVRSAKFIEPAKPATAVFESGDAGKTRQDLTHAAS